ncbi:MAG TPA: hypothetical protein PLL33_01265 [Paracoccus sp. (in: a-proteobacteria)]|nr:hypothetical protein [Paracoccus sp. (in: a-proteobacteria)]
MAGPGIAPLIERLRGINRILWQVEDDIRAHEARQQFDGDFIALARAVYRTDDDRSAVKRAINLTLGSALVEKKCRPAATATGSPAS